MDYQSLDEFLSLMEEATHGLVREGQLTELDLAKLGLVFKRMSDIAEVRLEPSN